MDIISLIIAIFAGLIAIAAIVISLVTMNNKGPQGSPGPQGATGPIGPTGPSGIGRGLTFNFNNGVNGNIDITNYTPTNPYRTSILRDEFMYLTGSQSQPSPSFIIDRDNTLRQGQSFIIDTADISVDSFPIISNFYSISGNPVNTPFLLNSSQSYMFTLLTDGVTLTVSYSASVPSTIPNNPNLSRVRQNIKR